MAQMVPLILDRMLTHLQATVTSINSDHIKIGRWLADPTQAVVRLALVPGNPQDALFRDGVASLEQMPNIGIKLEYIREVGGGELWWRRFTAMLDIFYTNQRKPEEEAMLQAFDIYGLVLDEIPRMNTTDLIDDFGETALYVFNVGSTMLESGGENQWIWRGSIFWQVLTERP